MGMGMGGFGTAHGPSSPLAAYAAAADAHRILFTDMKQQLIPAPAPGAVASDAAPPIASAVDVVALLRVIGLLPLLVWQPLERRTGTPPSALERGGVDVVIVLALGLVFLSSALNLSAWVSIRPCGAPG